MKSRIIVVIKYYEYRKKQILLRLTRFYNEVKEKNESKVITSKIKFVERNEKLLQILFLVATIHY